MHGPKHRSLLWLGAGLVLTAIGFVSSWTQGVNLADESWFLQVLTRMSAGDVLYRDIFFGVTPLSAYIALVPVRIFGSELLVTKLVMAICYAVTILLAAMLGRQLGQSRATRFLLVSACAIFTLPDTTSPYKAFAQIFFLLCLGALLHHLEMETPVERFPGERKSLPTLLTAGVFAGLCFLCYQSWGAYTLAAALLAVALGANWRALLRNVLAVGAGFTLTVLLFLLPVVWSGGLERFIDYGFLNKTTYLETAGKSYLDALGLMSLLLRVQTWERFRLFYQSALFLLPPVAFALLVLSFWRAPAARRRTVACVLLFGLAAFLSVFPRVDWPHFLYSIPLLLLALAFGWQEIMTALPAGWQTTARTVLMLWLVVCALGESFATLVRLDAGQDRLSTLPHFQGALFPADEYAAITSDRDALQSAGRDAPVFISVPEAGFYYLITGLSNPSPFDYPLVTAFGMHGQEQLVQSLSQKRLNTVCMRVLHDTPLSGLRPALLESYVLTHMKPQRDLGVCVLYENP